MNNVVCVSDLHCGCQSGLITQDGIVLDNGTPDPPSHRPNKLQLIMWDWWIEFWNWIEHSIPSSETYCVVFNGDIINGVPHGTNFNFTNNMATQIKLAQKIIEPIKNNPRCQQIFLTRGTEAHVGKSAEFEELLSNALGINSRFELWLRIGVGMRGSSDNGTLVHFSHHIGFSQSMAYEGTALSKELTEAYAEASRFQNTPPDIIVRSHRHRYYKFEIPTKNKEGIGVVTPGWQLKTPFSHRLTLGRVSTPQIGGILVRHGEEVHYVRPFIKSIQRDDEVVL